MKKNSIMLLLILSTTIIETSPLFLKCTYGFFGTCATAIAGIKAYNIKNEKGFPCDGMTTQEIIKNLNNDCKIWNKFGFFRWLLRPDIQPKWNTMRLTEDIILQRTSTFFEKNNGMIGDRSTKKCYADTYSVNGPLAKMDLLLIACGSLVVATATIPVSI